MMENEQQDDKIKTETTASISSSIMLKIPAENMSMLRQDFQETYNGLELDDFLISVITAMNIEDEYEMMLMVADLIDFFHLVDVNGDKKMQWEEFVMFILDAVVKEPAKLDDEKFLFMETRLVQSAAVRNPIRSAIMVKSLGKFIMGVGGVVQIYGVDDKVKPSNTHLVYQFPIIGK